MDLKDKIMTLFRVRNITPVFMLDRLRVERSLNELADAIVDVCQEEMTDAMMHYVSELAYYQQRVEELELDLMLEHEAFQLNQREQANINPKRRTTF